MEYNTQNTGDFQNQNFGQIPPNNNLVWAILSTLFCCLPTGIYAIIKAAEVNSKWNAGDRAGAVASAAEAKKWAMYGAIAGVVGGILYFLFFGGMALLGGLGSNSVR